MWFWRCRRPAVVLTLAAVVPVVLLAGCGSWGQPSGSAGSSVAGPRVPSASVGTRTDIPLPPSLASLPLVDSGGHRRTLGSFAGKLVVLSDGMTLCQETCPLDTASVVATARAVDKAGMASKVEFVTVTVDPVRDHPAQLAAYRGLFKPVPHNWVTLTGRPSDVARLWRTLGVYTQKVKEGRGAATKNWRTGAPLTYDVDHSDEVFFFGGDQHERFVLEGPPHVNSRAAVPKTIYRFMDQQGRHNLEHPKSSAWTVPQALQVICWMAHRRIPA